MILESFLALPKEGHIYISKNGGQTWKRLNDQSKTYRSAVDISYDGQIIVIAEQNRYLQISKDGGDTWSMITNTGEQQWTSLSMSDDGQVIAAVVRQTGKIFYSQDGGNTWNTYLIGNVNDPIVEVSGDGKTIVRNDSYFLTGILIGKFPEPIIDITPPTLIIQNPTNITSTTATINFTSDEIGTSTINYGLSSSYGSTTEQILNTTNSISLTNLIPNTTYHYQIIGVDENSNSTTTSNHTFTTLAPIIKSTPSLTINPSTHITQTSITLNATITHDGNSTTTIYGFVYGENTNYGATTTNTTQTKITDFNQTLNNLKCSTSYNAKAYAINSIGINYSPNITFTTNTCPSSGGGTPSGGGGGSYFTPIISTPPIALKPIDTKTSTTTSNIKDEDKASSTTNFIKPNEIIMIKSLSTNPRDLKSGISGNDVKLLQEFLNKSGFIISKIGAGSIGKETTYFGPLTRQALAKFQKAHNINPPQGYFGPITRAFIKTLLN